MDLDKKLYEVVIYLFIFVQCPRHGRLSAIVTDNYDKVSFQCHILSLCIYIYKVVKLTPHPYPFSHWTCPSWLQILFSSPLFDHPPPSTGSPNLSLLMLLLQFTNCSKLPSLPLISCSIPSFLIPLDSLKIYQVINFWIHLFTSNVLLNPLTAA